MEKLTVIIPTYNEEEFIEEAIKSVLWADEIMVVDSFSTDRTLEIARRYTDFVLEHEYINSATQKNWAIPQASHSWVFVLDADERATPELKEEIQEVLRKGSDCAAFRIRFFTYFMGKPLRFSGLQTENSIRLFRRDECRYKDKHVHSGIVTDGAIGELRSRIIHYTYRNLDHFMNKAYQYTTWGAYDRLPKTRKITFYHLWFKPHWRFFRHFILQLGILDGRQGFIYAKIAAYKVFLRSLKIWLIQEQGESYKKEK